MKYRSKQIWSLLPILIGAALMSGVSLSGCSLLLDPTICETKEDCGDGVCQEGVCIGPARLTQAGVDGPMGGASNIGGAGVEGGAEGGVAGASPGGADLLPEGGRDAGSMTPLMDQMVPRPDMPLDDVFSCAFDQMELEAQGVIFIDQTGYSSRSELILSVRLSYPESGGWGDRVRLLLDGELIPLNERESGVWVASLNFDREGERRVRLTLGDEEDIKCTDALNLTFDQTPPQLEAVNPSSTELWLSAQQGAASATVTLSTLDLAPISLYVNDEPDPRASGIISNEWSLDLALTEGVNTYRVQAVDVLDQRAEINLTYHYDATPPAVEITTPGDQIEINQSVISLSGIVYARASEDSINGETEPLARVEVVVSRSRSDGGREERSRALLMADDLGAFEGEISLTEGLNHVSVCAYDRAENQGCASLEVTYVHPQPCVEVDSLEYSASTEYTLTGTICPLVDRVTVQIDQGPTQEALIQGERFSLSLILNQPANEQSPLPQSLQVIAYTTNGDSATATQAITVDQTPPDVRIFSPVDDTCTNAETLEICGRVLDPQSGTVTVSLNQQTIDLSDQVEEGDPWWEGFCVTRPAESGEVTLTLQGENGAGVTSESTVDLTVDRVAPFITFDHPESSWYRADDRGVIAIEGVVSSLGCSLSAQGFRVYALRTLPEGGVERDPVPRAPNLDADGRFIYQNTFNDGPHAIEVNLLDRGDNERVLTYTFSADRSPPLITLVEPNAFDIIGRDEALDLRFTVEDNGSGVDPQQITANGQTLTVTPIENTTPTQYEATGALNFSEGAHEIELRAFDQVGNEGGLNLNYLRDTTAPVAVVISPLEGAPAHPPEVMIVNADDDASGVQSVTINGVEAIFNGSDWVGDRIPIDLDDPHALIEVTDFAGNTLVDGLGAPAPYRHPLTSAPYVLRAPTRSALPGEDEGFISPYALRWGQWTDDESPSIMAFCNRSEQIQPPPTFGATGGFSASLAIGGGLWDPQSQPRLPTAEELTTLRYGSVGDALTIFTLSVSPEAPQGETPTLRIWRRASEVSESDQPIPPEATSPDEMLEVRLGLPALSAHDLLLADISGDGRLDVLLTSDGGARLLVQDGQGGLQLEVTEEVEARGLTGVTARGALWALDLNGDQRPDIVQGDHDGAGARAWITSVDEGSYLFTPDPNFPTDTIDQWLQLDWDEDGTLDLVARTGRALALLTLDGAQWTRTPLPLILPEEMSGVSLGDLDMDGVLELIAYGTFGVQAYDQTGRIHQTLLPELIPSTGPIHGLTLTDLDQDGDEDLILSGETGPWLLLAQREAIDPNATAARLSISRGSVGRVDALNVYIRVDLDGDFTFERVLPARPYGETLLPRTQEGMNIQVVFPDRDAVGGNRVILFDLELNATISVADEQD